MPGNILVLVLLFLSLTVISECHITGDKTLLSELKKTCEHAYVCFHDTVTICGKSVNEARTFLDLCDLYEYSCEHSMVFKHYPDEEGICPNPKDLPPGIG